MDSEEEIKPVGEVDLDLLDADEDSPDFVSEEADLL